MSNRTISILAPLTAHLALTPSATIAVGLESATAGANVERLSDLGSSDAGKTC